MVVPLRRGLKAWRQVMARTEEFKATKKKFLTDPKKLLLHAFDVLQEKCPVAYQPLFKSGRLIEQLVYEALACVRADIIALCIRNILVTN